MKWIGLTGGIGSGKSTVAEILRNNGIDVIDADAVAREVTEKSGPGFGPVVSAFGKEVVNLQGGLDRRRLGEIVFSDKKKLEKLEGILHPLVKERVAKLRTDLEKKGKRFAVYDVPLLFEKNMQGQFSDIIVVSCSVETQVMRSLARGTLEEKEIRSRISAQIPLSQKVKNANYVIANEGTREDLEEQVEELVKKLK
ncbi:MAG: hypothetical protein A4S09_15950 [Proteobacteria bacterium SG_bin7]|nr:MAG: hypothetical protein A4S09_15950 [Proteobacteria bacterium SG_bin7]